MKKVLFGTMLTLVAFLVYQFHYKRIGREKEFEEKTVLIEKELKKVSKLIVTENSFTQVMKY